MLYGWLHRTDSVISSGSNGSVDNKPVSFREYFVVCTRSDFSCEFLMTKLM